ncbi:MAG: hypothetical protein ACRDZY_18130 [Acidimicrobiales bacterium]
MDGPGFHVEVEALEGASTSMAQVAADQDNFALRGLCGEPPLYGHDGVHDALAEFCGRWSVGRDALADRARSMGDLLGTAAKAYRQAEHNATGSLTTDPGLPAVTPDVPAHSR